MIGFDPLAALANRGIQIFFDPVQLYFELPNFAIKFVFVFGAFFILAMLPRTGEHLGQVRERLRFQMPTRSGAPKTFAGSPLRYARP
jgi:hypothetical protein